MSPICLPGVAAVLPNDLDATVRAGQRSVDLGRLLDCLDVLLKCGDARYNTTHGLGPLLFGVVSITSHDSKGFPALLSFASSRLPSGSVSYCCLIVRVTRGLHKTYRATDVTTGDNPSRAAAESLLAAIGSNGPVFAYYAQFEKGCIEGLAKTFPDLGHPLHALSKRLIDLLPIVRDHYYHPNQHGSWSIKDVLPTIAPDLRHDELDGVQNGEMAMSAYTEAVAPNTLPERREEIRKQLWDYCCLDTLAMVRVWEFLLRRA